MNVTRPLVSVLMVCIACGACADDSAVEQRTSAEAERLRQQALELKTPEKIEPAAEKITGEVPAEILGSLREDLEKRGIAHAEVIVAEAVAWPNGALGCPKPGQIYTQVVIPGYRIVFARGEERWDYRVGNTGGFILCDRNVSIEQTGGNPSQ